MFGAAAAPALCFGVGAAFLIKQYRVEKRFIEPALEGKIDEKLRWTPSNGQVVSIRVESSGGEEIIPIQIPDKFSKLNIEREQRYAFKVEFEQGGIPVATDISRL